MNVANGDSPAGARHGSGQPQETSTDTGSRHTLLRLEVSHIRAYERNPRRHDNPEYERIKSSIRANGMTQPLVVTQRPGETDYIIQAGGNTRLRILKELYAETKEARFGVAECVVRPWRHEVDVLLAHLTENELRGDLTFLERSLAVHELKRLVETEEGGGPLSQQQLAELLTRKGYSVSQPLVSQMAYAVEKLLPLLPQALDAGMGRSQIERIRALDRATRALWCERSIDGESAYEAVFSTLCRRYDAPEWDIANLRRGLEVEIAASAPTSIQSVSIELDARLAGCYRPEQRVEWREATEETVSTAGSRALERTPDAGDGDGPELDASHAGLPRPAAAERLAATTSAEATPPEASVVVATALPQDVKSLRARAWVLASRLAQRNGLGELVQSFPGNGLGFLLRDVPDPALTDRLDEEALAQVSMLWWQLAACAEMTVAPVEAFVAQLDEACVLRRALETQDAGLLFSSVWTLDPGHTGYRLWRRLDERDWVDLLALMGTYRALHRTAQRDRQGLWHTPP